MAVADDDYVEGAVEKSSTTFGCLEAARLLVAVAVTVLIVVVIGYAVSVVLRPGELSMWVAGGSVSVKRSSNHTNRPYQYLFGVGNLIFTYTIRAVNPSGRVRIYYTNVTARLRARNSSSVANSFLGLKVLDMALTPDSAVDTDLKMEVVPNPNYPSFMVEYFEKLGNGSSIDDAWLEINGTRTVENFSGHNMTGVPATYYCWPLPVVAGDQDDHGGTAANNDLLCKDNAPTGSSS